jgi:uncharacterized tellurite resistance protein B-like protein
MLQKIKNFLESGTVANQAEKNGDSAHSHEEHRIAAAALLIEAADLDGQQDEIELATIRRLVGSHFEPSAEEAESLFEAALARHKDAVEIHQFTNQIKNSFSEEDRIQVVEMLWEVVYADGVLHDYEANLLRRIGGLIHVTDRDRGDARKRAMTKLGLTP